MGGLFHQQSTSRPGALQSRHLDVALSGFSATHMGLTVWGLGLFRLPPRAVRAGFGPQ